MGEVENAEEINEFRPKTAYILKDRECFEKKSAELRKIFPQSHKLGAGIGKNPESWKLPPPLTTRVPLGIKS